MRVESQAHWRRLALKRDWRIHANSLQVLPTSHLPLVGTHYSPGPAQPVAAYSPQWQTRSRDQVTNIQSDLV